MANKIDALQDILDGLDADAPFCVFAFPETDGQAECADGVPERTDGAACADDAGATDGSREQTAGLAAEQTDADGVAESNDTRARAQGEAEQAAPIASAKRADTDAPDEEDEDVPAKKGKDGLMPAKKRPFALRMGVASDRTRTLFCDVLNRFAYYGVRGRAAGGKMNFKHKGVLYGRMSFSGKTLRLHLPLSCAVYDTAVYGHEDYSRHRGFEQVPFTVKLSNKKLLPKILTLIDNLMTSVGIEPKKKPVVHDVAAEYPTGYTAFEQKGYGYLLSSRVTREDVEGYSPRFTSGILLTQKVCATPERWITATVSLAAIADAFRDGDAVDLAMLRAKGLAVSNANRLVVTAADALDKKLFVTADEFEPSAIAELFLVGGSATVLTYVG